MGLPSNYITANERLTQFHEMYKDAKRSIITKVVAPETSVPSGAAIVRAEVYVNDELLATGMDSASNLDEKKALAKAETAAVSRALVFMGFGVLDDSDDISTASSGGGNSNESQSLGSSLLNKAIGQDDGMSTTSAEIPEDTNTAQDTEASPSTDATEKTQGTYDPRIQELLNKHSVSNTKTR